MSKRNNNLKYFTTEEVKFQNLYRSCFLSNINKILYARWSQVSIFLSFLLSVEYQSNTLRQMKSSSEFFTFLLSFKYQSNTLRQMKSKCEIFTFLALIRISVKDFTPDKNKFWNFYSSCFLKISESRFYSKSSFAPKSKKEQFQLKSATLYRWYLEVYTYRPL